MSLGQQAHKKGTGVMPSAFVLCAGVAEPDDESDGRQSLISPRRRLRRHQKMLPQHHHLNRHHLRSRHLPQRRLRLL